MDERKSETERWRELEKKKTRDGRTDKQMDRDDKQRVALQRGLRRGAKTTPV